MQPTDFPGPTNLVTRRLRHLLICALGIPCAIVLAQNAPSLSGFTFQGSLASSGTPASGPHDFEFRLFDSESGGNPIVTPESRYGVAVATGDFSVMLDFGLSAFDGTPRWIEVSVRQSTDPGAFTPLLPRQRVTVTPYAMRAISASNLEGVSSGGFWKAGGNIDTQPGQQFLGTLDDHPLELGVSGQRALHIQYAVDEVGAFQPNVIGGHPANQVYPGVYGAFIGGGGSALSPNRADFHFASVVGGLGNTATGRAATAMGWETVADNTAATAMGHGTSASGGASTAMGSYTQALATSSTAMGEGAIASGSESTAMGGFTTASGTNSTAMGWRTTASAFASTAMGARAQAIHYGSFVWADPSSGAFSSSAENQFAVRATGGVRLDTFYVDIKGTGGEALYLGGDGVGNDMELGSRNAAVMTAAFWNRGANAFMNVQAQSFQTMSDRDSKEDFAEVDPQAVLAKVAALPLSEWSFKSEAGTRHIGPMAQDFHAAFGLGASDRHIATVDADGVALAAIQGLNRKLESELERKDAQLAAMQVRLERVEQLLQSPATR